MICQTSVVVMEPQVSRANLTHPQLLLLKAGGWHRVSVLFLVNKCHRIRKCKSLLQLNNFAWVNSLLPLHPSSLCEPSPLLAEPFGPHPHFLQLQAAQPWPAASLFLHSAHGLSLPTAQHRKEPSQWDTLNGVLEDSFMIYFLTFAATSALISSWVSASRFFASSVLRSQSAMNDSRWSTAF